MAALWGLIVSAVVLFSCKANCRPTTFSQDFNIIWSETNIHQLENGTIQLVLDQNSGCGFASKNKYLFGRISMQIKLIQGDSAGTVATFYMISEPNTTRDELDFEFLGNRSGQPYTIQTNVFTNGTGGREQRVNLWFDPSAEFHTYSILWNHNHIVFYVDVVPIRVFKNNEAKMILFPKSQSMRVQSSLWAADDWATRGGLEKIDWNKAPFYAYVKDVNIESCPEGTAYQNLSKVEGRLYRWVRMNYMIYDYCTDRSRYKAAHPECAEGI